MKALRSALVSTLILAGSGTAALAASAIEGLPWPSEFIPGWAVGNVRTVPHKAMDVDQHPVMMLVIFGSLGPNMSLVEVAPTDSYWSEFFGGALTTGGRKGHMIQVADQSDTKLWNELTEQQKFLSSEYGITVNLTPLNYDSLTMPGTADMILLSKKMAVFMRQGNLDKLIAASYKALKPGGTLIVEDYRANTYKAQDPKAASGYIREDYAIDAVQKAGFQLTARDDKLFANPKDAKTQTAQNSDRFLLKFTK